MRSARTLSLSLLFLATGPFVWLACGGGKPPETPADESSSGGDSGSSPSTADSSSSDTPAASGSAGGGDTSSAAPAASSASAPAAAAPPTLGSTDCGKCLDTTCAKPAAACAKNNNCQEMIDAVHGCSGSAGSCLDGATPPSAAKPKKLAAAYGKCAKKALTKACKAQCSQ